MHMPFQRLRLWNKIRLGAPLMELQKTKKHLTLLCCLFKPFAIMTEMLTLLPGGGLNDLPSSASLGRHRSYSPPLTWQKYADALRDARFGESPFPQSPFTSRQSPLATTTTAVPLPPLSLAARFRVAMDAAAIPPCDCYKRRDGKNIEFCS